MTINDFFHTTMEIGLAGEGVHFVYISLDFRGESLPSGIRELAPDEMPSMSASRSSFDEMPNIDSIHGNMHPFVLR